MSAHARTLSSLFLFAFLTGACGGCQSPNGGGLAGVASLVFSTDENRLAEQEKRTRYLEQGDPEALRWLLANRVRQGMELVEVDRALGRPGTREYSSNWIKNGGTAYRSGDAVYRWGPDSSGHTLYLVFREGHLVNFDHRDYAD